MEASITRRDGFIRAGLYAVYAGGILGSASALYDFAVDYGGWNHGVGVFLPLSLDVYWMTALGIVMDSRRDSRVRAKAAIHAAVAIAVSIAGNMLYHELHAGDLNLSRFMAQVLVAAGGAVPVLAAGALTHLTVLARAPRKTETGGGGDAAAETETAAAAAPVPRQRSGNGSRHRAAGNDAKAGNGSAPAPAAAEATTAAGPAETETGTGTGTSGNGSEPSPATSAGTETEAAAPRQPAHGGNLTLVAADDADTMRRAREIVEADPGILDRFGGPTELGTKLDLTGRRGRQLAAVLRAEREPADEAGAL
jgi:hypothetical protein